MIVATVLGARPQFIKAAVVSAALRARPGVTERVIHTGQHFDDNMSDVFFRELEMAPPAVHLGVSGGTHAEMTGAMMVGIEKALTAERPDLVLVYGDTNSTLAGAVSAAKLQIPVAHVEAGLRSFNRRMPEEINRIATDRLSTWLFAPTGLAVRNLEAEGVPAAAIVHVGDVMYDVALRYAPRADECARPVLAATRAAGVPYVLATVHRAENTDAPDRLEAIVQAFASIAERMPIVWPVHPRTRLALARRGLLEALDRVALLEPQGYLAMLGLQRSAAVIATDSGGVQKEAFFCRVPCVTLREETEWVELVELGWNRLAPPRDAGAVRDAVLKAVGSRGAEAHPYGDGRASELIASYLAGMQRLPPT